MAIRAALISVGGSPAPILFTLRQRRPQNVWYFCSAGSRVRADEIHTQLDWHPDRDIIEVERFEELGPCYREVRQAIPGLLKKWNVRAPEVLIDYTGGTKTMSAALVLAASEIFDHFTYVGGEQREKGGLGITIDGKERILYHQNPWSELAIREIERACDLWDGCQFDSAADVLLKVAPKVSQRLRFSTIAELAQALAARHRLDFHKALQLLTPLKGRPPAPGKIHLLIDGREAHGLLDLMQSSYDICVDCCKGSATPIFIRELLDNTLRTAAQGRYEDAAARLYRAMEMQAQLWLAEATNGAFQNGRLKPEAILPDGLAPLPFCKADDGGEVKLSLEQLFRALDSLGHSRAAHVVADLSLDRKSRWRRATEKRNASILAHGVNAIGQDGFGDMKQIACEFLGFDLSAPTWRIPELDPRWF